MRKEKEQCRWPDLNRRQTDLQSADLLSQTEAINLNLRADLQRLDFAGLVANNSIYFKENKA